MPPHRVPGTAVAVLGAGPIGTVCLLAAKAFGASKARYCTPIAHLWKRGSPSAGRLKAAFCILNHR